MSGFLGYGSMRGLMGNVKSNLKGEVAHPVTCNNGTLVGMRISTST